MNQEKEENGVKIRSHHYITDATKLSSPLGHRIKGREQSQGGDS